jgi:hypothetical protein
MNAHRLFLPAILAALPLAVSAQTMVEHSAVTANAASAGGMKSAGKGAASLAEKAAKVLDRAAAPQSGSSDVVVLPGADRKPEAPAKLTAPDPDQIKPGMDREELIRKFGPPAMKTSATEDSHAVETWWYGGGSQTVEVKLVDGKVRSAASPKPDAAVAVLP